MKSNTNKGHDPHLSSPIFVPPRTDTHAHKQIEWRPEFGIFGYSQIGNDNTTRRLWMHSCVCVNTKTQHTHGRILSDCVNYILAESCA